MSITLVALVLFVLTKGALVAVGLFHAFGEWETAIYAGTAWGAFVAMAVGLVAAIVCLICGSWAQRLIVLLPAIYFLYYVQRLLTTVFA
jgi:hypothetical protein